MDSSDRRQHVREDRRARPRGGRRNRDAKKPWYLRRRLWLTAASLAFVTWRRMLGRERKPASDRHIAA